MTLSQLLVFRHRMLALLTLVGLHRKADLQIPVKTFTATILTFSDNPPIVSATKVERGLSAPI